MTDTRFQPDSYDPLRAALESIAGWSKINISGEYEHGLRDIIRSITDCAAAALEVTPQSVAPAVAPLNREQIAQIIKDETCAGYADDKVLGIYQAADAILAALPSEAIGREWQDISTAPKNGEPVLIYVPINTPDRRVLSAYWTDAGWWICSGSVVLGKPTHWMSLPAGPAVTRPHHSTHDQQEN